MCLRFVLLVCVVAARIYASLGQRLQCCLLICMYVCMYVQCHGEGGSAVVGSAVCLLLFLCCFCVFLMASVAGLQPFSVTKPKPKLTGQTMVDYSAFIKGLTGL